MSAEIIHGDCLDVMRSGVLPVVDAIVTDPPYGIGAASQGFRGHAANGWHEYPDADWDAKRPAADAFRLMVRIAPRCVVWGGNYFADILPPSMGWLCWDKGQRGFSLADFELAWTSERRASRCVQYARGKALRDGRFHPTQKPIAVMAESIAYLRLPANSLILDPFCGSGTTGVAAVQSGHRFIGIEQEAAYVDIARRRIVEAEAQLSLLAPPAA